MRVRKVVDGEVEMVVVMHMDDILAQANDQATIERFIAELRRMITLKGMGDAKYYMGCHIARGREASGLKLDQHLYVKAMVKTFGVEKARRISAFGGGANPLISERAANPRTKGEDVEVPIPGDSEGAHLDGNDDTVGHCVRGTRCG